MGTAVRNPDATEVPFDSATGFETILPGVEFRTVFGDRSTEAHGTIVRVQAGAGIPAHFHTEIANGIVLNGLVEIPVPFNQTDASAMPTGGAFSVPAMTGHEMNCVGAETCEFYLRQDGAFDFNPVPEPASTTLLGIALLPCLALRRRITRFQAKHAVVHAARNQTRTASYHRHGIRFVVRNRNRHRPVKNQRSSIRSVVVRWDSSASRNLDEARVRAGRSVTKDSRDLNTRTRHELDEFGVFQWLPECVRITGNFLPDQRNRSEEYK